VGRKAQGVSTGLLKGYAITRHLCVTEKTGCQREADPPMSSEILFQVKESPEGGYEAPERHKKKTPLGSLDSSKCFSYTNNCLRFSAYFLGNRGE
jgi:hypothetical protein